MTDEEKALEAIKAQMMPMIDASLKAHLGAMRDAMQAATQSEIDRCIQVVAMCKLAGEKAEKPHGHAWNTALDLAIEMLGEWKQDSAKQATATTETRSETNNHE